MEIHTLAIIFQWNLLAIVFLLQSGGPFCSSSKLLLDLVWNFEKSVGDLSFFDSSKVAMAVSSFLANFNSAPLK